MAGETRMAGPGGQRVHTSTVSSVKKQYLILYNAINACLWLVLLLRSLLTLVRVGPTSMYTTVGNSAKWTQTIAIMEIVHAALGIVRAPLLTTFLQVWSRLFVVWGIVDMYPHVAQSPAYSIMLVAYGCSEVIRYSYFALNLSDRLPETLQWLRYNAFIILYPMGISSEYWQMWKAFRSSQKLGWSYQFPLIFHLIVWPPSAYILIIHMISQRRKTVKGKLPNKKQ